MTSPSLDEIISLLGVLPGKQLIAVREVALPQWALTIKCRIQDKKDLPALEEYVLRSMDAGLHGRGEIQSFLGISADVVEFTMANLYSRGLIQALRPQSAVNELRYALTQKGSAVTSALSESMPRSVSLDFTFDGLTHEFGMTALSDRLRPRDIKEEGLMEVPAFPTEPPVLSPADTPKLQEAFARTEAAHRGAELLKVIEIEGKRSRFFTRAVALVFHSLDDIGEHSIIFAVDGRRSVLHERAFEQAEGLRKLGILDSLKQSRDPALGVVQSTILQLRTDNEQRESLKQTTLKLRQHTATLASHLANSGTSVPALQEKYDSVSHELESAEEKLDGNGVRLIDVTEHPHYLDRALSETANRLLIVSPWLRTAVIDKSFSAKLRRLLQNGVDVKIAYGIGTEERENALDRLGRKALQAMEREFENFTVMRLGDTHAKVLISDERFVIVTSFNWLSFKGDSDRPFRDERGTLIAIPSEISRLYNEYAERIDGRPQEHM